MLANSIIYIQIAHPMRLADLPWPFSTTSTSAESASKSMQMTMRAHSSITSKSLRKFNGMSVAEPCAGVVDNLRCLHEHDLALKRDRVHLFELAQPYTWFSGSVRRPASALSTYGFASSREEPSCGALGRRQSSDPSLKGPRARFQLPCGLVCEGSRRPHSLPGPIVKK